MTAPADLRAHRRAGPIWIVVLTTGLIFGAASLQVLSLLRDVLRSRCEWIPFDASGDWVCADGNGYILGALAVLVFFAIAGVVGLVVIRIALRPRGAVRPVAALLVLPTAMVGAIFAIADPPEGLDLPALLQVTVALCVAGGVLGVLEAVVGPGRIWLVSTVAAAVAFAAGAVCFPALLGPAVFGLGASIVAILVPRPVAETSRLS